MDGKPCPRRGIDGAGAAKPRELIQHAQRPPSTFGEPVSQTKVKQRKTSSGSVRRVVGEAPFVIHPHFNDSSFFEDRVVPRCDACQHMLGKWSHVSTDVKVGRRLDVGASYDGVLVVSKRFREWYAAFGCEGLTFTPLADGRNAWVRAERVVSFDTERKKVRCNKLCSKCGQFWDVVGATPVHLRPGQSVGAREFVQTDLEFASGDEKGPLLICGFEAGCEMEAQKFAGLEMEAVRGLEP